METETKSTHKAEVVELKFEKHPNADKLVMTSVWGYNYIGNVNDWHGITKGVFIPPDSLVDTTLPEFAILAGEAKYNDDSTKGKPGQFYRVKAKKLRGIVSYGYMIPAPVNANIGDDLAEKYGIKHYDPPLRSRNNPKDSYYSGGEVESPPDLYAPKYDVDSFQRYAKQMLVEGELVHVSEKLHGANGRWVYHNNKFYCGSRTEWKREYAVIPLPNKDDLIAKLVERSMAKLSPTDTNCVLGDKIHLQALVEADKIIDNINKKNTNPPQNMWWKALRNYPLMMAWLEAHPDVVIYGEVYGQVQNLQYGTKQGELLIGVFDILVNGNWMDIEAARLAGPELPWVPVVEYTIPYNFDCLLTLAEGNTLIEGASNIREGVVVRPLHERNDPRLGRVQLKIVSPVYLQGDY